MPRTALPRGHRFRWRLAMTMVAAGLLPAMLLGVAGELAVDRMLGITFSPVLDTLDSVDQDLGARKPDEKNRQLAEQVRLTRLHLAQAELVREDLVRQAVPLFAGAALVSAALLLAMALLLGRRIARRVELIADAVQHFARGDFGHRIPARTGGAMDELDYLDRELNHTGEELAVLRERVAVAEQLAAWRTVARVMAHELANPLTAMKMALARLTRAPQTKGDASGGSAAESIRLLEEEVDVLLRLTESFATFAKLPDPKPEPVDLHVLICEVAAFYRDHPGGRVEVVPAAPIMVHADRDQMRRAIGNLVKNAIEASNELPGPVQPVQIGLESSGGKARIIVRDSGSGIAAAVLGSEVTRGITSTKRGGSGLGLPTTQRIAQSHGGMLQLRPRAEGGTEAILEVPV